jgi:transcriptional regulator GlxA family with amidase domain
MQLNSSNIRKIIFLIPPKVQLLDLTGPIHVFYEAIENNAPFELYYTSIYRENKKITSCAGLQFANLIPYDQIVLSSSDYIFVPGINFELLSDIDFLSDCTPFFKWLKEQCSKNVHICSICTGAFLLAHAGVLESKNCTTHWNRMEHFAERFPDIKLSRNKLFVVDKNIYSSAGVTAGIDMALHIIELELGVKSAIEVAKIMVIYFRRGEEDSQISAYLNYRNHMDNRVHEVQNYIMNNLESSSPNIDVADSVYMSVRNLTRLFKKTTGITLSAYRENLRIERASQLLAEKNTLETVTKACGLKSIHHLRTLIKKHKGKLPSEF